MRTLRRFSLLYIFGTALVALLVIFLLWFIWMRSSSPIPSNILQQLDFKPFVVVPTSDVAADQNTYKYDATSKSMSFVITTKDLGKLTVSEQTTPPQFIDIPDYYTKLLDTLNRYSAFDNQLGTIYLTQPKTQPSGQTAIMHASGILMFVYSEKNLSDDEWRHVFNSFQLSR